MCGLSFFTLGCMPEDSTLDISDLSQSCKENLLTEEFLVKFKHESHYRTVKATDAESFLTNVIRPHQEQIESYGLNFKLKTDIPPTQVKNLIGAPVSWVKGFTRSEFLTTKGVLGQGVKIAVLDTGLDLSSGLFDKNLILSAEPAKFVGQNIAEKNTNIQDLNGHGTIVSSLIAGPEIKTAATNFEGGLAPQAQIIPVKIFSADTRTTDLGTVLKAIDFAIASKVNIINASWGGSENCSPLLENKLVSLWGENILFITSAGDKAQNLSLKPSYPASFGLPSLLAVSAINANSEIPSRANFGGTIGLFAPGQDVPVIGLNGEVFSESGTSLAAAIATGGAALLKSAFPSVSAQTLSQALSVGSLHGNHAGTLNIMDLKSSFNYLSDLSFTLDPEEMAAPAAKP